MKKVFFLLAVVASAAMTIQTGLVKNAHALMADKTMCCSQTTYSNGDTKISCSGSGSECAVAKDCKGCFD